MNRLLSKRSTPLLTGVAATLLVFFSACAEETIGTPTLRPARTAEVTSTPNQEVLVKTRVSNLLASQVAAIQREDWETVYQTCSPQFRASRTLSRYVADAISQFARDGYRVPGFEARNVEPSVRAQDRVLVRWDAYQDGAYIRTEEVGETYIFTQGAWFDDGAWCR